MTCIIGIDPGTSCGWAVYDGTWTSGVWDLKPNRFEGGGMRFLRLRKYLRELILTTHPEALYYEEVRRHMGTDAAHIYGGILAIIESECEVMALPYAGVPVGKVKKFATGKGNASKADMIAAAKERWRGWEGDDNEADARWIAAAGLGETG